MQSAHIILMSEEDFRVYHLHLGQGDGVPWCATMTDDRRRPIPQPDRVELDLYSSGGAGVCHVTADSTRVKYRVVDFRPCDAAVLDTR